MSMEEINEVYDLQDHLGDLEIVQDHIVVHHLSKGTMVVVKDQEIAVPLYFLLYAHICRDMFICPLTVLHSDTVESYQVGAWVGLQLFDV